MVKKQVSGSQELFGAEVQHDAEGYLVAHVDGGARGNPGPAGYGVVMEDEKGRPVARLSQYLGHRTNNYAEYMGLLAALKYTLEHGFRALKVISDSELMVRQLQGRYKVKSPALLEHYQRARQLIAKLHWFRIEHTLREGNAEADRLANLAMDEGRRAPAAGQIREHGSAPPAASRPRVIEGVVRDGVIDVKGRLAEGTRVRVEAI